MKNNYYHKINLIFDLSKQLFVYQKFMSFLLIIYFIGIVSFLNINNMTILYSTLETRDDYFSNNNFDVSMTGNFNVTSSSKEIIEKEINQLNIDQFINSSYIFLKTPVKFFRSNDLSIIPQGENLTFNVGTITDKNLINFHQLGLYKNINKNIFSLNSLNPFIKNYNISTTLNKTILSYFNPHNDDLLKKISFDVFIPFDTFISSFINKDVDIQFLIQEKRDVLYPPFSLFNVNKVKYTEHFYKLSENTSVEINSINFQTINFLESLSIESNHLLHSIEIQVASIFIFSILIGIFIFSFMRKGIIDYFLFLKTKGIKVKTYYIVLIFYSIELGIISSLLNYIISQTLFSIIAFIHLRKIFYQNFLFNFDYL